MACEITTATTCKSEQKCGAALAMFHLLKDTETWSRVGVTLRSDSQEIQCKLWREKSNLCVNPGDNVVITNMLVASYRNRISLNSTDLTSTEVYYKMFENALCDNLLLKWTL